MLQGSAEASVDNVDWDNMLNIEERYEKPISPFSSEFKEQEAELLPELKLPEEVGLLPKRKGRGPDKQPRKKRGMKPLALMRQSKP